MAVVAMAVLDVNGGGSKWRRRQWHPRRRRRWLSTEAPMTASLTAVDGGGGNGVVTAVEDERQPLAFGGHCRLLWQQRWRSSTAVIAIAIDGGGKGRG
jgi:hypothetical protein